jgi:hypothetical protein
MYYMVQLNMFSCVSVNVTREHFWLNWLHCLSDLYVCADAVSATAVGDGNFCIHFL